MTNRCISAIVKGQEPLMLTADTSVQAACQCMYERHVGAVLIVDHAKHLKGIFTGRDAVHALGEGRDPVRTRLDAVMTRAPATISPDQHAIDALRAMNDGGYRHLPVVEGKKVVAIVARADFEGLELDRLEEETSLWERVG
jgi:CBS domain-containing protein